MWLLFLGLHLTGIVGYNLTLRKLLTEKDKPDPWQLATIMQIGIALPLVFVLLVAPPDFGRYGLAEVGLIGLIASLQVGLQLANVKALQYLETSVFAVLYNLRIILVTFFGVLFLQEEIVPLRIMGGLLIFLAIVVIRQKGRKDLTAAGIWWGVLAAVVISLLNMFVKVLIGRVGFIGFTVPVMLLALTIMLIISAVRKQSIPLKVLRQPRMISLMSLRAMSSFGFDLALAAGSLISVSNYISSLSVIILVILGVLLLHETDYLKRKIWAAIIALLGLTAILVANLRL